MNKLFHIIVMMTCVFIMLLIVSISEKIVIPIVTALFLTIILNPIINSIRGLKYISITKNIAIISLLLLVLLMVFSFLFFLSNSLSKFVEFIYFNQSLIMVSINKIFLKLKYIGVDISIDNIFDYIELFSFISVITAFINNLFYYSVWIIMVFLLTFFMLFESDKISNNIKKKISNKNFEIIKIVMRKTYKYFLMKTAISVITGGGIAVILFILGVRFYFIWGFLAFILNYIPNVGSIIAAIPPILQSLIFYDSDVFFIVLFSYLAVNLLIGSVLEPKFFGDKLNMPATVAFMSLLFWGGVLGIFGAFLSIPLTIVVITIIEKYDPKAELSTF